MFVCLLACLLARLFVWLLVCLLVPSFVRSFARFVNFTIDGYALGWYSLIICECMYLHKTKRNAHFWKAASQSLLTSNPLRTSLRNETTSCSSSRYSGTFRESRAVVGAFLKACSSRSTVKPRRRLSRLSDATARFHT